MRNLLDQLPFVGQQPTAAAEKLLQMTHDGSEQEKDTKTKPREQNRTTKQLQSSTESNVINLKNTLKLVIVLALLCVYNQLIVYQVESRLKYEFMSRLQRQLDAYRPGDDHRQHQAENQQNTTVRLARQKRQTQEDNDNLQDYQLSSVGEDSVANETTSQPSQQLSSSDRWLLDYLTGESELEQQQQHDGTKRRTRTNNEDKKQRQQQQQCLCPPGKFEPVFVIFFSRGPARASPISVGLPQAALISLGRICPLSSRHPWLTFAFVLSHLSHFFGQFCSSHVSRTRTRTQTHLTVRSVHLRPSRSARSAGSAWPKRKYRPSRALFVRRSPANRDLTRFVLLLARFPSRIGRPNKQPDQMQMHHFCHAGTSWCAQWTHRDPLSSGAPARIVVVVATAAARKRPRKFLLEDNESNERQQRRQHQSENRPRLTFCLFVFLVCPRTQSVRTRSVPSLSLDNLGVPAEVVAIKVS